MDMFHVEEEEEQQQISKRFELGSKLVKQGLFSKIDTSNEVKLT
jgi:hypothetical protein